MQDLKQYKATCAKDLRKSKANMAKKKIKWETEKTSFKEMKACPNKENRTERLAIKGQKLSSEIFEKRHKKQ